MEKKYTIYLFVLSFILVHSSFAQHSTRLMGVTSKGGNTNLGTIYQFDLGTQTHSVNFNNTKTIGKKGSTGLVDGGNGKLYGTTELGGAFNGGVIYEVNTNSNTYTAKFELGANPNNGFTLLSKLVLYNNEFYGTASGGITQVSNGVTNVSAGIIFKWNPTTNIYTKLVDFSSATGGVPVGTLALLNNKLYGVTKHGGLSSHGTIFEYDINNTTIINKYDFANSNLFDANAGLFLYNGSFFGTCNKGGINNLGVIYEWQPTSNVFSIRADMSAINGHSTDGTFAELSSNLYLLNKNGGVSNEGTLIEFNPSTFAVIKLIDFSGTNGTFPQGELLVYNSELYGTATINGANNFGTIFKYNVASTLQTKLFDFNGFNGGLANSFLMQVNNKFYGATSAGGSSNGGTVYSFDPSNNNLIKIEDLDGSDGNTGIGSLISYNNKFYGIDSLGGEFNKGVLYEFNIQTGQFINLYSFNSVNGERPNGELTVVNNKLYGTTKSGGTNGIGILYEFNPTTNVFTKQYDFAIAIGSTPVGRLSEFGGKLYGCARLGGGVGNKGSIFEYNLTTNVVVNKVNLSTINGVNPNSGMVLFSNNRFYGTTENGGNGSGVSGVLFEYNPSTNAYSAKVSFNTANGFGNKPQNELAIYGNKVYGITRNLGANSAGTIYKYEPSSNTATKLHDFTSASSGSKANGLLGINGKIFGTCMDGGANTTGTLFELDTLTNLVLVKHNFLTSTGATPIGGHLIALLNPNYNPIIANIPSINNGCNNITGESLFNVNDLDNDSITFTLTSSNTALIPSANLSVNKIATNQYKLIYTPIIGQIGNATIIVTANDGFGGIVMDSIVVNVFGAPTVIATASVDSLCSGFPVTLNGVGAVSYVWNNAAINNTPIQLLNTTTFIVTGTDANNCSDTAQIKVKVNPLPNIIITASTDSVCNGNPVVLSSTGVLSPTWNNGIIESQSFIPVLSKYYTVSGSDIKGCSNSDSIQIIVNPLPATPIIIANLSNPICVNSSVNLSVSSPSGAITWSGPSSFTSLGNSITVLVVSNANYTAISTNTITTCVSSIGNYAIVANPCLGLENYKSENLGFTMLPNPTNDYLNITSERRVESIAIYTALGQRSFEWSYNNSRMDVSKLKTGLYTVVCNIDGVFIQKKLIIQDHK